MEGSTRSLPNGCSDRSLGELVVIWAVIVATFGVLLHQLVLRPSEPALAPPSRLVYDGPAHVTRFDVMYAHPEYTKLETFKDSPAIMGNSGLEILVAGQLSQPLAAANLVLADGTLINAESDALADPNNPVARFRFELQDSHQGAWYYQMISLTGETSHSGPLLLIVLPEKKPSKSWPSWPEEPTPASQREITVT